MLNLALTLHSSSESCGLNVGKCSSVGRQGRRDKLAWRQTMAASLHHCDELNVIIVSILMRKLTLAIC